MRCTLISGWCLNFQILSNLTTGGSAVHMPLLTWLLTAEVTYRNCKEFSQKHDGLVWTNWFCGRKIMPAKTINLNYHNAKLWSFMCLCMLFFNDPAFRLSNSMSYSYLVNWFIVFVCLFLYVLYLWHILKNHLDNVKKLKNFGKSRKPQKDPHSQIRYHFLHLITVPSHILLKFLSPRNPCKKSSFPGTMVLTFPRPFNNGIVQSCFLFHLGSLSLHIVLGLSVWLWVPRVHPCFMIQQLSCGCLIVNGMWIHSLVHAVFDFFPASGDY